MKKITVLDSSLDPLLKHIERFEALPSSKRYFQEIFTMSINLLENYGERASSIFHKRKNLIILHSEPDYCFGLDHIRPRFKKEEILFLCYTDNKEEKELTLERVIKEGEFQANRMTIVDLKTNQIIQRAYD